MKNFLTTFAFLFLLVNIWSQEEDFVTDVKYIQEVVVRSSSTQAVLDLYSQNILDYRVYGRDILTLKKKKRNYYIGIEYADKEAENYLLEIEKPRSIYTDCMNNVFILNDDYAYQFVITDKIKIISVLTMETYNANVKSCVGNFDNSILIRNYTDYNKAYHLNLYNKKTKEKKVVYHSLDTVSLNNYIDYVYPNRRYNIVQNSQMRDMARIQFSTNQRGNSQSCRTPNSQSVCSENTYFENNIILRNNLYNLPSIHPSIFTTQHLGSNYFFNDPYKQSLIDIRNYFDIMILRNMFNKKIDISTFQLDDENYVVIDRLNYMVSIYNKEGILQTKKHFDFEEKVIETKQDPYTREIYFTSKTENLFKVHRLNIEEGTTHYVGGFKNIMLARTIKIFDGWIYYRVKKNDYYKLYRTRLRS